MRPAHHEPDKVNGAISEILSGAVIGGSYGSVAAMAVTAGGQMFVPFYKGLTVPIKTFIGLSCIIAGACFKIDRNIIVYEQKLRYERQMELRRLRNEAAERGEFIDISGRVKK